MPVGFRGWNGVVVRWQGVVVGSLQHGYSVIAEDCKRGIGLGSIKNAAGGAALEQALFDGESRSGLLLVDVSGKIATDEDYVGMIVTRIHELRFVPMNERQEMAYWHGREF